MNESPAYEPPVHEPPVQRDTRRQVALAAYRAGRLTRQEAALLGNLTSDQLTQAGTHVPHAPLLSVVLPVFNEEENIQPLANRLLPILQSLGTYEVIFVSDGSRDGSAKAVLALRERDSHVRFVSFSRNFGHQAALCAGIDHARGEAVVLMDSDGQDPPELLPDLVKQWRQGFAVVYAVRRTRRENVIKRWTYRGFYRLLCALATINIPLDAGDFCLMDRRVVDALRALPERSRFLRGLRSWVGFDQIGVEYDRPARMGGQPKYTFRRLVRLALDGLLSFSIAPLRLAVYLGFVVALVGVAYLVYALVQKWLHQTPAGWTSLAALILLLGGAQLLLLGVLGEYVGRVYEEAKQRPVYVVAERYGFEPEDEPRPIL